MKSIFLTLLIAASGSLTVASAYDMPVITGRLCPIPRVITLTPMEALL